MIFRIFGVSVLILGLTIILLKLQDTPQFMCPSAAPAATMSNEDVRKVQHAPSERIIIVLPAEPAREGDKLRDSKVAEGLRRFMEKTSDITKQSVDEERAKIVEGMKLAQNVKPQTPEVGEELDENGQPWQVLDYGNGVVRYLPSREE